MDLLQGALLTGATATGVVIAERVRHRGSKDEVREDVTRFGTDVAEQVGRLAGVVGRTSGRVLGRSADVATRLGDTTTRMVESAGRTMAGGAGAAVGAYAGMVDRVLPKRSVETRTVQRGAKPTASRTTTKRARAAA